MAADSGGGGEPVTRHVSVVWPDRRPFLRRGGRPIRVLAISDEPDPTLDDTRNRSALGAVDLVIGCGDASPDHLSFVAECFRAPLAYVRGNHDTGEAWRARSEVLPVELEGGRVAHHEEIAVAGLPWPAHRESMARRDELQAWSDARRLVIRSLLTRMAGRREPLLLASHAPPLGVGDVATDPYHRGFRAYRWLLHRLAPPVWLHGHTPLAARPWRCREGGTEIVNVTGSVLVELQPPG